MTDKIKSVSAVLCVLCVFVFLSWQAGGNHPLPERLEHLSVQSAHTLWQSDHLDQMPDSINASLFTKETYRSRLKNRTFKATRCMPAFFFIVVCCCLWKIIESTFAVYMRSHCRPMIQVPYQLTVQHKKDGKKSDFADVPML